MGSRFQIVEDVDQHESEKNSVYRGGDTACSCDTGTLLGIVHLGAERTRNVKNIEDVLKAIRPEFDFAVSEDFIGDGMLDSYDIVMLVAELDKTFGISLAGVDIVPEHFRNIAAIEQLLHKYGAGS